MTKTNKISYSRILIGIVLSFSFLGLVVSCALFENDDEYTISDFDNNVSDGLMDNLFTVLLDTVMLAVLEPDDSLWTDSGIDSLLQIAADRDSIVAAVTADNAVLKPSEKKLCLIAATAYNSGYAILDLSQETNTDNLVFFLDNFISVTIWDMDGNLIDLQDDIYPTGMLVVSDRTKERYEYNLDAISYLVRFTKAETLSDEAVKQYNLVLVSESAEPSASAEKACGIMDKKNTLKLQVLGYSELDSNWTNTDINYFNQNDSLRQLLVSVLDEHSINLDSDALVEPISVNMSRLVGQACFILDLSNYQSCKAGFYVNWYEEIQIISAVDSVEVLPETAGITYAEAGACSDIRNRAVFNLAAQQYIVALSHAPQVVERSKFMLVILDEG